VVAELECFTESLPVYLQPYIHIGVTSSDIEDYADRKQIEEHLEILEKQIKEVGTELSRWCLCAIPTLGRTHLQPAEPTTVGYRFAVYAQEYMAAMAHFTLAIINYMDERGFRGAVGTDANRTLLKNTFGGDEFSGGGMAVGQVYPRQQDLRLLQTFDAFGSILGKMALDLRVLQMQGEALECKPAGTVGSSAMPAKSNPIRCERISGLVQTLHSLVGTCWQMATQNILERTLDEKVARRIYLPEAFLCFSEILSSAREVLSGMFIDHNVCRAHILENWRSWLPSRVVSVLQARSFYQSRKEVYTLVEESIAQYDNARAFLHDMAPILEFEEWDYLMALDEAHKVAFNISNRLALTIEVMK
jgi:adenylosuccinate lyase